MKNLKFDLGPKGLYIWIRFLPKSKDTMTKMVFGQDLNFPTKVPSLALLWKLRGEKSGFGTLGTLSVDSYGRRFGLSP